MSLDPFKAPPRQRVAQRIRDLISGRGGEELEQIGVEKAEKVLKWADCPYHKEFLSWLREEADKPIDIAVHAKMIVASTRANTFRQVLDHLTRLERRARAVLTREP